MSNPQPPVYPVAETLRLAASLPALADKELQEFTLLEQEMRTRVLMGLLTGEPSVRSFLTALIVDTVQSLPREVKYVPAVGKVSFTPRVVRPTHWWTKVAVGAFLGFLAGLAFLTWVLNPGTIQFFGVTGMIGDVVDTWGFETIMLLGTTGFGGLWGILFAGKTRIWIDIEAPDMNTGKLVFVDSVPVSN